VAVVGAYRELPPPLKELIDWDQQRLDVQVKYDQVVQHFAPERLLPSDEDSGQEAEDLRLTGPLVIRDLTVTDPHGGPVIEHASLECELPARLGVTADGGPAAGVFARILARRTAEFAGEIRIQDRNWLDIPKRVVGRRIAYAGVDPILFPGTIRDNLVYGLRQRPLSPAEEDEAEAARRIMEAKRTGNPLHSVNDRWVDCSLAGAADEDELDAILITLLKAIGFKEDIYRFGLAGMVDPEKHSDLAERIIEARIRLRERLLSDGMADLVEPFDRDRYNHQATLGENLLFGVPTSRALMGRNLAEHAGFREALEAEKLTLDLASMGARIAETMVEIFRGLPPGHPLFEQFSFVGAEELPEFDAILRRHVRRGSAGLRGQDLTRVLALPLAYIEPRHRLGLLDEAFEARLVHARGAVRERLTKSDDPGVEFYDPDRVCAAAPLKDNLLFGRVSHNSANAQTRVTEAITAVIDDLELRPAVERVGLDHQVGPSGRMLNASQRASVNLVRCLVKRPDMLVVDGALAPFGEAQKQQLLQLLLESVEDRTLVMVLPHDRATEGFDALIRFRNAQMTMEPLRSMAPAQDAPDEDEPAAGKPVERRVAGVSA